MSSFWAIWVIQYWPVNKKRIRNIDVSDVKLENNPDVWATEILWSGLKERLPSKIHQWVIAGDFNASENFDYMWAGGQRGNKIVLDKMKETFNKTTQMH